MTSESHELVYHLNAAHGVDGYHPKISDVTCKKYNINSFGYCSTLEGLQNLYYAVFTATMFNNLVFLFINVYWQNKYSNN